MSKIYLTLKKEGKTEQFEGKDGKMHDCLWTINRKITGNMQLSGATINSEARYIDFTLPTEVEKLPRDAKPVDNETAEKLWASDSHYFGE
ncbi:hypothetical protein PP175_28700 (plasmid) [Aneurinibacillus sp. Ricciae_BoGa-3]|uniref:hypothetical protein n=1 Tax=Aneurinibacillus sp. Ricciae_BoGa-3 TaxID=3022697 RepID=UPI002340D6D2|nr:hypothetical protein [Aneurinibacillus sp. Ricciae_BoGa-3]WCK57170.1 hypothetical protein PP175_28700 [Aneurinibacillus sp. Ricciae_BoGa-3]